MRLLALMVSVSLVLGGFGPVLAQQSIGPATLENLLDKEAGSATRPIAADAAEPDARRQTRKGRLQATVVRPTGGVQHPDLDKAWADYEAAVAKAAESLKTAITKQFDEATAKGDLGAAEKWQAALERFEKDGDIPALSATRAVASTAISECKKAKEELAKAYEAVVKALTMAKQIEEAKATRDEWGQLSPFREAVFLSDLPAKGVSVGHGTLGINGDMGYEIRGDKRAVVNGKQLHKSISMHPPTKGLASATFDVPSGSTHFEGSVAINDGATNHETPLIFKVYGENHLLWASKPLKGPGQVQECREG